MKIALAQINTTVGDIDGNHRRILEAGDRARRQRADLLVLPELCAFGYPPRDAVYRTDLVEANVESVHRVARAFPELTLVVGFVMPNPSAAGRGVFNAAAVCRAGRIDATYAKMLLPTYDVFDEARYFQSGDAPLVTEVGGVQVAITICEDLWNDAQFDGRPLYGKDPVQLAADRGAELLINLSASPFRTGVFARREELFARQARRHGVAILYVNLVGGNDDILFDGGSMVMDAHADVPLRLKTFEEDFGTIDWPLGEAGAVTPLPGKLKSVHDALVMGIRDYIGKCGFASVVVGLSGGIDSALTAVLAARALGPERVHGIAMPSRYNAAESLGDARTLAQNLGVRFSVIPIEDSHRTMEKTLAEPFRAADSTATSVAEENVQARIRGTILMSMSNKFGALCLATGNKSEWAVGYCTLYGDMCGGLAVLSDVPKTTVFELARWINAQSPPGPIPERTITRPPSAELREAQTDQDTLPPYDVLDRILDAYVTRGLDRARIIGEGLNADTVDRVLRMVDRNEHKRKQAPVGLKVTSRAFGSGWRMPIAARLDPVRPAIAEEKH